VTKVDTKLTSLIDSAWQTRVKFFPREIQFDYPHKTKALSLTGQDCDLNCAHCGGHYLKQMQPASREAGSTEKYNSYLVSGGCSKDGKLPLEQNKELIKHLRQQGKINLHSGLVSSREAAMLPEICDTVSFDMVGDDVTIQEVYGLNLSVSDLRESYNNLRRHVKTLPHICIGLNGGEISGEYNALDILSDDGADGLVFLVFVPTRGTRLANNQPPPLEEVGELLARARNMFPTTAIHLGCMRPGGLYRKKLDCLAVKCGVNKIVLPVKAAVKTASDLGLTIKNGEECCVL